MGQFSDRVFGVDIGTETIKLVVLGQNDKGEQHTALYRRVHYKDPYTTLSGMLAEAGWTPGEKLAATGRLSRGLICSRVPTKAALTLGVRFLHSEMLPGTIISVGSHGFSVLELQEDGSAMYRENSRCSQGTGNFLSQLVERFDMSIEQASTLSATVDRPVPLSGRCPVILKTDMTHLANKGEDKAAILAGLYDAVCENVQSLLKPETMPGRVVLTGGVTVAPRVRTYFRSFLERAGMELVPGSETSTYYLEALGAALVARDLAAPHDGPLFAEHRHASFQHIPPLTDFLPLVHRLPAALHAKEDPRSPVTIGYDIGSTGAKAVAVNRRTGTVTWEHYLPTQGDPIGAAQRLTRIFLEETGGSHPVLSTGVTGSGREIVGSLLSSCYGSAPVVVMNEIAAHAEGALHHDPDVDTIFEIGGQDAKYTRLEEGHIIDAAMNEACSAGTGSFIAEQGSRFEGTPNVSDMSDRAMRAPFGVSLGQHCSVFIAEVISDAVAERVPQDSILAGLYDSVAQNYLNRVKGNRSVGKRIFCQGMPFHSDALAAAIARQTGRDVVIPPNPGTIGALGIALIALRHTSDADTPVDLAHFLEARLLRKETFVCNATKGCGGTGNKCRIERLHTLVDNAERLFFWGGSCSLYDNGISRRKLPDGSPDPFRERRELMRQCVDAHPHHEGRPTLAMVEEFALKAWVPFFVAFFDQLGCNVTVHAGQDLATLKRGIEAANVPFCAPMQLYQGVVAGLRSAEGPDYLFSPRIRECVRHAAEPHAGTCPIVQAAPDIISLGIPMAGTQCLTGRVDMGEGNLASRRFRASVRALARSIGKEELWETAYEKACETQTRFEQECQALGRRAVAFARTHSLPLVVVLGRGYTLHNTLLNANVPGILREQGALAVPMDCYPLEDATPVYPSVYWGASQGNLRAAYQIRRTPGQYAVYCSNYSCGPDSFTLHFFSYLMENRPFAIIETDGHSGDAGTRTRIEAFLYCVQGDTERSARNPRATAPRLHDLTPLEGDRVSILDACHSGEILLIPRMGPSSETIASMLCAEGARAEALPIATQKTLRFGHKHTSGKECIPLALTLGGLLERLEEDRNSDERFAFLMPTANGPCRFGMYNMLQKIILEKSGWSDRVRIISPSDEDYFAEVPLDFQLRTFACFAATDMLQGALHDVRPVETAPGRANALYATYMQALKRHLLAMPPRGTASSLYNMTFGVFGIARLLRKAAREFAAIKDFSRSLPTVSVVGEIFVRLDSFANGNVIEALEHRGIRCRLAPFNEWFIYSTLNELQRFDEDRALPGDSRRGAWLSKTIQYRILHSLHHAMGGPLGWPRPGRVEDIMEAATPFINPELVSEAILSVGTPVLEYGHGLIDGVVAVGPHECMPNKIVESQLVHVERQTGLATLTLSLNGEPTDPELLDRFAFEVHEHHAHQ